MLASCRLLQLLPFLLIGCPSLTPNLCAATTAEGPRPLQVRLEGKIFTAIPLPEAALMVTPLDNQVQVGLYLPTEPVRASLYEISSKGDAGRVWYANPEAVEPTTKPADLSAVLIQLHLDKAFTEGLSMVIRRLFPQNTIQRKGQPLGPDEVRIYADFTLRAIEAGNKVVARIKLTITEGDGDLIESIEGAETVLKETAVHWTAKGRWGDFAAQVLTRALEDVVLKLRRSRALGARLRELAVARALPSSLVITARFDDSRALLPDDRLNAGEEARIAVEVANEGPGVAYDVVVRATGETPQVTVSGNGSIGDLAPGARQRIELALNGHLDLPSTLLRLRIETLEKRGYGARPVSLEVAGEHLLRPELEIVDVVLNDRSGRAKGDGDGQPGNGETIEAVARIRNGGPGPARGVVITLVSPTGAAEVLEPRVVLPRIEPDRVQEARLLFRLPLTVEPSDLPLKLQAVEARGPRVASAVREQVWKISKRLPGIELAYRVYDGTSVGSKGNGDGQINNGERIEVAVTPTNRGSLLARGIQIAVASNDPRLTPRPAVLELGDLPVRAEGAAQRFAFEIPRAYGQDRSGSEFSFSLTITQQDFPSLKQSLALRFQALHPDLSLEADAPASLLRGSTGELVFRCRNKGELPAEDVAVDITSETPGVDLLDERGVPVRSRKLLYGTLDRGVAVPPPSVRLNVRRNAALGSAVVRITVSQRDFPSISRTLSVAVGEEPATVIPAERHAEPALPVVPAPPAAVPATISFLRNTPGQHLLDEAIVLRFEVQASSDPVEVRLSQNERLIPLEAARRSMSAAGDLQAVQYEIPVQLDLGENRFTVVVVTRQGLRNERSLALFRDREIGRLWVIAIGVSKYQDPAIRPLGYADADAQAVASYFRDTFALSESQIFLRINERATLREIKSILGTQIVARANNPRDTVIVYFAGHGLKERASESLDIDGLGKYFLPYDAVRSDLYSSALEMDEVTQVLRRLEPERVVVLLDSCFSGAAGGRSPFDPKARGERALISSEFLDRMAHLGKGRVVITASEPDGLAEESSEFGHGVFTYYLLKGLRGNADVSGDGNITVHEVYDYVSKEVVRETDGRQKPKLKEPDLVGQILIGRGGLRRRH